MSAPPRLQLNIRGGSRISVPAVIDQITPYVLLEQEDWFEDEIRFVRCWLRPGMRAVDVGASFGTYTLAMARAVGADGSVHCFEPAPLTAGYLRETLHLNGLPQVVQREAAVSDKAGRLAIAVGPQSELNAVDASGGGVEVEATTLDEEARRGGIGAPDFIKLDVEGHEAAAIEGARGLLAGADPLVMLEVKARQALDFAALAPLAALGYAFYRLLPGPLLLSPFDPEEPADDYLLNVFACKPGRAARLALDGVLADDRLIDQPPPAGPWADYCERATYAVALRRGWRAAPGAALEAYACARDARRNGAERAAWLAASWRLATEALAERDDLASLLSAGRVAADLGLRADAIGLLEAAQARLEGEDALPDRAFLAPAARYEAVPADDARGWLACAVGETRDQLQRFCSALDPDASLAALEPIAHLPQRSPAAERRRQLARMFRGLQAGPEAVPRLRERGEDNLNPEFWSGQGVVLGVSGAG